MVAAVCVDLCQSCSPSFSQVDPSGQAGVWADAHSSLPRTQDRGSGFLTIALALISLEEKLFISKYGQKIFFEEC